MVRYRLDTLEHTERLAQHYANNALKGHTFLLSGDLGAGKSSFARAFIRSYFNEPHLDVPSPTYTLIQTYGDEHSEPACFLHHMDLYRLSDSEEIEELGMDYENSITLIEWPERLSDSAMPDNFIRIRFSISEGVHIADITTHNMSNHDDQTAFRTL